jgi:dihydrodipicolinate synthase/N-acetylneuraminate lyase
VPAIASENAYLSLDEKVHLATSVQRMVDGQVPVFWGTGSFDPDVCIQIAQVARRSGATGCLIAVSPDLYRSQHQIVPFFSRIASVDISL